MATRGELGMEGTREGEKAGWSNGWQRRRGATAGGAQDTMMNVIALSGWQTLGLLDFYQLLLLRRRCCCFYCCCCCALPIAARRSAREVDRVARRFFSQNSHGRDCARRALINPKLITPGVVSSLRELPFWPGKRKKKKKEKKGKTAREINSEKNG